MFGLLRFIRGVCGFVFALQVFYVFDLVDLLFELDTVAIDIGKLFASLLVNLVVLGVSGFLFFWFRELINRLHIKKNGTPHPALAEKELAL